MEMPRDNSAKDIARLTVFGRPAEQGRWVFIPLGMLVLLCLGTVYSWSVFRKPLEAEFNIGATESPIRSRWFSMLPSCQLLDSIFHALELK
jgi:hypothetical protein